uniref:Uncharacterized protein n=1 Tax=Cacopsylla melanoneura TaxID=428564 RepID=A0A8D8VF08_9HEMI
MKSEYKRVENEVVVSQEGRGRVVGKNIGRRKKTRRRKIERSIKKREKIEIENGTKKEIESVIRIEIGKRIRKEVGLTLKNTRIESIVIVTKKEKGRSIRVAVVHILIILTSPNQVVVAAAVVIIHQESIQQSQTTLHT